MNHNDANCEYSYYIDNYYRCTITGQVCKISIPDYVQCMLYDIEKEKRRKTLCNRQKRKD